MRRKHGTSTFTSCVECYLAFIFCYPTNSQKHRLINHITFDDFILKLLAIRRVIKLLDPGIDGHTLAL